MKEKRYKRDGYTTYIEEFLNIEEFYKHIMNTPISSAYNPNKLSSEKCSYEFSGTNSFDEAIELLKNGSEDIAKKINSKINTKKIDLDVEKFTKNFYDVQGYQCCVPLYLQGVPTNMIAKKQVVKKQKIITITKVISYSCAVSKDTILDECVKTLRVVRKIEAQGIKCNLNVLLGGSDGSSKKIVVKIRVKNANERLNISKLAFCMVHPSMLRRIYLRYLETNKHVKESQDMFVLGYGFPLKEKELIELKEEYKDEYLIPAFIGDIDVENIDDLRAIAK